MKITKKSLILCFLVFVVFVGIGWIFLKYRANKSINQWENENWQVREGATKRLDKIGKPAVGPLITALKDEDADIRWRAARSLGDIEDSRAIEPLTEALKDRDRRVRYRAIEALEKIGESGDSRVIEPLIFALDDEDLDVRRRVVMALERIGMNRQKGYYAVETLFGVALGNENIDIRHRAFVALLRITTRKSVGLLDWDTALSFGTDSQKWQEWWEINKDEYTTK